MAFDANHFRRWAQNELPGGRRPATVDRAMRRLRNLSVVHGLELERLLDGPAECQAHGNEILTRLAQRDRPHHHRNAAKLLNWLAAYLARPNGGDPAYATVQWALPWAPESRHEVFSDDQVHAILFRYKSPDVHAQVRIRALAWICVATGLRRGEIADLKVHDLDEETSTLKVGVPRKRGFVRRIPLPSGAWRPAGPLQRWLRERPRPAGGPDWLWTSRTAGRVTRRNGDVLYNRDLFDVGAQFGFLVSFNRFRHWRGHLLVGLGVSRDAIGYTYGHTKDSTTQTYTGLPGWQRVSTEYNRAGLAGFRAYRVEPPTWLNDVLLGRC